MAELSQPHLKTDPKIRFLAFRFYQGCPVGCEHCAISAPLSKPIRSSVTTEDVLRFADFGESIYANKLIFMTGSELLVGDEEFRELAAELVLGRGYTLGILTSAYWARTDRGLENGIEYLRLCGVSHVQLSVDAFHARALSVERASHVANAICSEGFSLLINATSHHTNSIDSAVFPGLPSQKLIFQPSTVGRGRALPAEPYRESVVPHHICDFGRSLYLQGDRNVYHCSGPGGMARGRAIGVMGGDSTTIFKPNLVTSLALEIEQVIGEPSVTNGDNCSRCAAHFLELDYPWRRGLTLRSTRTPEHPALVFAGRLTGAG